MFKFLKKAKGQSTMEYVILIIIIIGALVSIQVYIKRSVQGRLKSAADDIGEQFSPGNTNWFTTTTSRSNTLETYNRGVQKTTMFEPERTNIVTNVVIQNVIQEFWGIKQLGE